MLKTKKKTPGGLCRFPHCPTDIVASPKNVEQSHSLNEITWRIFRIMAEFVDGFQFLSTSKKEVTVFGSAKLPRGSHWYQEAERLGQLAARGGFTVITGGGPGLMEAANKGAFEAGGESLGLNIELPMEQRANDYLTRGKGFHYFFTRKVMLSASAQAYIFFPGGFGTLDELFEMLVLIETKKAQMIPVVLIGKEFWAPLLDWISRTLVKEYETLHPASLKIMSLVDTGEEAWEIIRHSKERHIF